MPFVRDLGRRLWQPVCSVLAIFGSISMSTNDDRLHLAYDSKDDLLMAWIGAPEVADSVEVEPGFAIRVSRESHRVVGLEVIDASVRFKRDASSLQNHSFVRSLLAKYERKP